MQCLCPLYDKQFHDMAPECAHPGFYTDIHNFGCFASFLYSTTELYEWMFMQWVCENSHGDYVWTQC